MNVIKTLREQGAIHYGHFLLTSGKCGARYIDVRAIAPNATLVNQLASELSLVLPGRPNLIVGPETLGRTLAFAVASNTHGEAIWCQMSGSGNNKTAQWPPRMNFERLLKVGARAVIVDDVLTTGSSLLPVINLLRESGVEVVGVGVLVRRGQDITPESLGVPWLGTLANFDAGPTYDPSACPQCKKGVPYNNTLGHGGRAT